VIDGADNIMDKVLYALSNVKECIDGCYDSTELCIMVITEPIWKTLTEFVKRGIRLRCITDINRENIVYCKRMVENGHQVRHLARIKTNFIIIDRMKCLANFVLEEKKPLSQIIVSNVKTFVEGQQYVFDTLWSKALPAEQKIEEIEGQALVKYETKVLVNPDEIFSQLKYVVEASSKRLLCSTTGHFQMVYNNFFDLYKKIIDKQRRGEGEGIRWITSIQDESSIELIKIFLNAGVEIRHIRNLPPMNFAVDDRYFHATINNLEKGNMMTNEIISNDPAYVKHFMSIFEEMWKNAVDASEAIRNIEKGVDAEFQTLDNEEENMKSYLNEVLNEIREIRDSH
jgi:sugar-specific transcriptional regulator TrmB